MLHSKYQPNIPSHSGEKVGFNGFAIFSIGSYPGFSTRLTFMSEALQSDHAACEI